MFFSVFLFSCANNDVFYNIEQSDTTDDTDSEIIYTTYLIGDAGGDTAQSKNALELLRTKLKAENPDQTAVVFLGDNIYPEGLHKKDHELRSQDEARLNAQINAVKDFKGRITFIPGNHDWKKGKLEGLEFIKRQEKYIQKELGKVFDPSHGCPGPKEIELGKDAMMIVIDTQWWLHQYDKAKGPKDDCDIRTKEAFLAAFKEALKSNRDKHLLVVGHHPLYSNGVHGGYFGWQDHLFPLTRKKKNLWIPLPLIGSIYPFSRSFFGNIQDIPHPQYQSLVNELVTAMNEYDNVVYAAGHEHNMQYVHVNRLHHVVAGSGSKKTRLKNNSRMDFGAEKYGFATLEYFSNGKTRLKYWNAEDPKGSILFNKAIYEKEVKTFSDKPAEKISYANQFQKVVPDSTFAASGFKRLFLGNLNRELWTLPIEVPVLDIHHDYGGLTPIGKGGGMQTISLKLKGGDGHIYKARGIKKNADFLVGRDLRGTLAQDAVYDGIAGSHPYASVAVPKFAKAAKIFYTEPRLVYIPKDPILGDYLEEFGGMFALIEIHPSDDMSNYENFGNSSKVINYNKVIDKLEKDPKNQVDVDFAVRSRLLDIFLGDWDRHDDQWRWAKFEEEDRNIYRPIPRDRDQVFFAFDGLVMNTANRKWLLRKFQPFKEEIRDIAGLCFNARYFDRYFLSSAEEDVWIKEAKNLQEWLDDDVIQLALKDLPDEAYEYNGEELQKILIQRRKHLVEFAQRYYKILAKEVDVRGTLEKDYFEVIRHENGDVEVNVYPRKKGEKILEEKFYHRRFKKGETKEIRLFGLDDKDEYQISGESKKSILVRIIASENKDKIEDKSSVKNLRKSTIIYDEEGKSDIELGTEAKLYKMSEKDALIYDRKAFKYDNLTPIPSVGVNPDDGLYFGPGFRFVKYGFNKRPFKYAHDFNMNYAMRAEGFNFRYDIDYIDLFKSIDLESSFEFNLPEVFQYYGEGNETSPSEFQIGNSDTRIDYYNLDAKFKYASTNNASQLNIHLGYQIADLNKNPFFESNFSAKRNQQFIKTGLSYQYLNVDDRVNPSKGLGFKMSVSNTNSIINNESNFVQVGSEALFYIPINYFKKQTVFAVRGGWKQNFGDYLFYQANFLSGLNEFRGVTRNRFSGESVAYGNAEIRKSLTKVKNYIIPFDIGIVGHFDTGRVWVENDQSDLWHYSYGGGLYFNMLKFMTLVGTYSVSDVDSVFNLGTQFYF